MEKTTLLFPAVLLPVLLISALFFSGCGLTGPAGKGDGEGTSPSVSRNQAEEISDSEPVPEGLLRLASDEPVETMDVHRGSDDYRIALNIFERLFDIRLKEDGSTELVPGLAESYEISEDGRTYRLTLRQDAFFSDGTPVTAHDVAYTFTRMLAFPESRQKDFADAILGASAVINHETEDLEGIEIPDDYHINITLSEPFAGYIYQLATPSCSILSEKCLREAGDDFGTSPETTIGSGPYMVTEYSKNKVRFALNPYYTGELPSAREVDLRILDPALLDQEFRNGNLDLLDAAMVNASVLKNVYKSGDDEYRIVSLSKKEIRYLMLNMDTIPLSDVRVRRGIQMAIDRQGILDDFFDGDGTLEDGIFPRGLIGYSEENQGWLKYDPEEAGKLFREAGIGKDDRLELAASSTHSATELGILERIRDDISSAGLNTVIVNYDSDSRMYLRRQGKLMAYTGSWTADYNDPDNFIYTFFGSREKTSDRSSNYADEEVMGRIAMARTIQDEETWLREYAELEKILVQDEAVWVPFFSTDHLYVLGERTASFTPYWAGWSAIIFKDVVLK